MTKRDDIQEIADTHSRPHIGRIHQETVSQDKREDRDLSRDEDEINKQVNETDINQQIINAPNENKKEKCRTSNILG